MNSAALASYGPRKQPELAFGLAVAVHLLLAALLFWGFRWEKPTPQPIQLEIWSAASQPQPSAPKIETPQPVKAAEPVVEDIQPAEINRKKTVEPPKEAEKPKPPVEKPVEKPVTKPPVKATETKPTKPAPDTAAKPDQMDDLMAALGKADAPAQAANKGQLLADYQKSLSQLILPRVIYSGDTSSNPTAEFSITILSSMTILNVTQVKSSGNPQWDSAAEKAILMNKKLPALPEGLPYSSELRTMRIKLCPKRCS